MHVYMGICKCKCSAAAWGCFGMVEGGCSMRGIGASLCTTTASCVCVCAREREREREVE